MGKTSLHDIYLLLLGVHRRYRVVPGKFNAWFRDISIWVLDRLYEHPIPCGDCMETIAKMAAKVAWRGGNSRYAHLCVRLLLSRSKIYFLIANPVITSKGFSFPKLWEVTSLPPTWREPSSPKALADGQKNQD